ncbi:MULTISPECIES: YkvA family protein [Alcaligenes]|uniref:hypothetical protein n=1 Tax=Alcaligenes TaxID=507 RepID=UPI001EF12BCE|nr:hypothetical protein [Alcaligenes faecalis]ULH07837.1 hypothetical protein MF263_05080 [Alcaligenes faecalis]
MSDDQFSSEYSENSFWDKVKTYAKTAGEGVLEPALKMYYAALDADTPTWAKTTIIAGLDISFHLWMQYQMYCQSWDTQTT